MRGYYTDGKRFIVSLVFSWLGSAYVEVWWYGGIEKGIVANYDGRSIIKGFGTFILET